MSGNLGTTELMNCNFLVIIRLGPGVLSRSKTLEKVILIYFFNILLTVHLNIFIYLYQPTLCTKFYNKFIFKPLRVSSTCAHRQEGKNCIIQSLVSSH